MNSRSPESLAGLPAGSSPDTPTVDPRVEGAYAHRAPLRQRELSDDSLALKAALVIDTEIGGRSCGGLRLLPRICMEELADLAKTMTLKQVYVGSARGGARAAIECLPGEGAERQQALINRFGELIRDELEGRKYLCARDIGSTSKQVQAMYSHVGMQQQVKPRSGTRSGYFTALSVLVSIECALGWQGRQLRGSRIAVEGYGKVGQALCRLLHERGALLVAVSDLGGCVIDERGLALEKVVSCWDPDTTSWKAGAGSNQARAAAATVPTDVFSPCADHYTIHSRNASTFDTGCIVAGANNAVTEEAERMLFTRGVAYLPDFITNAGGVLGNMLEYAGLGERHLDQILRDRVSPDLAVLRQESEARQLPARLVAAELLEQKLARMQQSSAASGAGARAGTSLAATLFNSPLFPRGLFAPLLHKRIDRGIGLS